jgi:hypothetical protein
VLLEGNSFGTVHGPHVDHLHNGRFSGTFVLPPVAPERHDCLTVGDEPLGHHGEAIADFPERQAAGPGRRIVALSWLARSPGCHNLTWGADRRLGCVIA